MLAFLQNGVQRHLQAAIYSLKVMMTKPFSMLITIGVIAVALTIPTLFWMLSNNLQTIATGWQNKPQISMYLTTPMEESQMQQTLQAVQQVNGVEKALLKTPAENLKLLEMQDGMQDIMRYLPSNPLPALIEIKPALDQDTPLKIQQLLTRLKSVPGVEQVKVDLDWIKRLDAILGLIHVLTEGMLVLLAFGVLLIIGNTLRLALNLRLEEIQVLKLIGATHCYIMRPFLYLGMWYGVFGAIASILLVNIFLFNLSAAVDKLVSIYQMHYLPLGLGVKEAYVLVLLSGALGWCAAQAFVRRQLSSIEPGS